MFSIQKDEHEKLWSLRDHRKQIWWKTASNLTEWMETFWLLLKRALDTCLIRLVREGERNYNLKGLKTLFNRIMGQLSAMAWNPSRFPAWKLLKNRWKLQSFAARFSSTVKRYCLRQQTFNRSDFSEIDPKPVLSEFGNVIVTKAIKSFIYARPGIMIFRRFNYYLAR